MLELVLVLGTKINMVHILQRIIQNGQILQRLKPKERGPKATFTMFQILKQAKKNYKD